MKRIFLLASGLFVFSLIQAQTKITKTNIIGKWSIQAVDMPGMIYYDLQKDSLAIGEGLKAQIGEDKQLAAMTSMMKPQMSVFTKMGFQFNTDGTAVLDSGMEAAQSVTYTVDEENSTISTNDKGADANTMKADIKGDNLRITLKQPQGEILLIMKKVKETK